MNKNRKELTLIYSVFDLMNAERTADQHLAKDPDTPLVAAGTLLDSLDLINFLSNLEDMLTEQTRHKISLLEDPDIIDDAGPLQTVETLARHLGSKYGSSQTTQPR